MLTTTLGLLSFNRSLLCNLPVLRFLEIGEIHLMQRSILPLVLALLFFALTLQTRWVVVDEANPIRRKSSNACCSTGRTRMRRCDVSSCCAPVHVRRHVRHHLRCLVQPHARHHAQCLVQLRAHHHAQCHVQHHAHHHARCHVRHVPPPCPMPCAAPCPPPCPPCQADCCPPKKGCFAKMRERCAARKAAKSCCSPCCG